jgi:hypothetical protein
MYHDVFHRDKGESEEEEAERKRFSEEYKEVYSGAYMDDGNSQRTLSQWKAVSRHQNKIRLKFFQDDEEPSGQAEQDDQEDFLALDQDAANLQPQNPPPPSATSGTTAPPMEQIPPMDPATTSTSTTNLSTTIPANINQPPTTSGDNTRDTIIPTNSTASNTSNQQQDPATITPQDPSHVQANTPTSPIVEPPGRVTKHRQRARCNRAPRPEQGT